MKKKVLCTAPFLRFPKVVEHFHNTFDGEIREYLVHQDLVASIGPYEGLIPNARIPVDYEVLTAANDLSAIYQPSIGYEHIDRDYCSKKNILFDGLGLDLEFKETLWSTAEHTISIILALLKKTVRTVSDVKSLGAWDNRKYSIRDLRGLEVGIIGFGNIGSKVAHLCDAFGAKISAYDPYINTSNFPSYVMPRTLPDIMCLSDVITLHVPLNDETEGMIAQSELENMKKNACLINVARGGIILESDLIHALKMDAIGGYGADVLDGESPFGVSGHELVELAKARDNILITPHLGGSSFPYMEAIFMHSINKLNKMLED